MVVSESLCSWLPALSVNDFAGIIFASDSDLIFASEASEAAWRFNDLQQNITCFGD